MAEESYNLETSEKKIQKINLKNQIDMNFINLCLLSVSCLEMITYGYIGKYLFLVFSRNGSKATPL